MRWFRSAITGRFVKAATYRRHPRITVSEGAERDRYIAALQARCLELRRLVLAAHGLTNRSTVALALDEERQHHAQLRAAAKENR